MNILFSCDEYPPVKSGGIGTVTKIVAEELARRGHRVYVVSGVLPEVTLPAYTIDNGVRIYRLSYFSKFAWIFKNAETGVETLSLKLLQRSGLLARLAQKEFVKTHEFIRKIIREKQIDLVEFPDYLKLSDYYKSRVKIDFPKYDIPVVARVHGSQSFASYYRNGNIQAVDRYNDSSFFNHATRILAVSRFSANFVNDKLGIKRKIDVIYNPLNLKGLLKMAEAISKGGERTKNIVFLGKVVETKGAFKLIEAYNKLALKHTDYKLIMIGGGEIDKGKSMVKQELRDQVIFTGYQQREIVCRYLKNATFCAVPSFFENFSMVALEIMALGKALIFTAAASGREVIEDGVDGLLVDPHDADEICKKMEMLAENETLRENIAQKSAEKIRNYYTIDTIVSELEAYYSQLIETHA